MREIIVTCDICKSKIEELAVTFTVSVDLFRYGYHSSELWCDRQKPSANVELCAVCQTNLYRAIKQRDGKLANFLQESKPRGV